MRICLFTATRAEYGIMKTLIAKLTTHYQLDLVVSGTHLEEKYGNTYQFIEEDGFTIARKIPLNLSETSQSNLGQISAKLGKEINKHFTENHYDLLIILGDRYELLPVVTMAMLHNIPICHIHGGEKTLGNFDEMIRHAITKMSHLHLVAAEEFKNRVLQLGEAEDRVHHIGSLGVENILSTEMLSRNALAKKLGLDLSETYQIVLFHPVTLENRPEEQIDALLSALEKADGRYFFIGANADTGSDIIMKKIEAFVTQKTKHVLIPSLASSDYHAILKYSKGLIGNSSSGIIEAPSLGIPTLNIGNRQKGRLSGPSVISVPCTATAILEGLSQLETIHDFTNPYEKAGASDNALKAIELFLNSDNRLIKDFYDR